VLPVLTWFAPPASFESLLQEANKKAQALNMNCMDKCTLITPHTVNFCWVDHLGLM